MEVDEEGNILLLSTRQNRIHKYFKFTGYDSLLTIGGKGIGKEGFNMPIKIEAPNRQNIYVLDDLNRRMVMLNTNLKIVDDINFLTLESDLLTNESAYLFPVSFTSGPSGELYLLNQEDNKVYKFNNFQQLERTFGGLDYGAGSLDAPDNLASDENNFIYVSDAENQVVTVFDLYGIFQYHIRLKTPFTWKKFAIISPYIVFFDESNLFFYNLTSKRSRHIPLADVGFIQDVEGNRDYFYLLTENQINLYPLKRAKK